MWDELDAPLGLVSGALAAPPPAERAQARARSRAAAVAIAIGLFAVARRDAPLGGEPFAVAKVDILPAPPAQAAAPEVHGERA